MTQNIFRPGYALFRRVIDLALRFFEALLDTTHPYSERRRNRRRPGECRAELTKYAAARPLFAPPVIRSVLELALNFFEDGIYAPLSQTFTGGKAAA